MTASVESSDANDVNNIFWYWENICIFRNGFSYGLEHALFSPDHPLHERNTIFGKTYRLTAIICRFQYETTLLSAS